MQGIYNEGMIYEIEAHYIFDIPYQSINQKNYSCDALNYKNFRFNTDKIKICPIGFDVLNQEVIVSTNNLYTSENFNEIYANYDEIKSRVIIKEERNLPVIARVNKENFIKFATLKV